MSGVEVGRKEGEGEGERGRGRDLRRGHVEGQYDLVEEPATTHPGPSRGSGLDGRSSTMPRCPEEQKEGWVEGMRVGGWALHIQSQTECLHGSDQVDSAAQSMLALRPLD